MVPERANKMEGGWDESKGGNVPKLICEAGIKQINPMVRLQGKKSLPTV